MRKRARPLLTLLAALATIALAIAIMVPLTAGAAPPASRTVAPPSNAHHTPHFFYRSTWLASHHMTQARAQAAGNNLQYGGGPVMRGTTNAYAIFWEPTGNVTPTFNSLLERYFGDVGGSPLYQIANQYTDSSGGFASNSRLAGTWLDRTRYPSSTLQDSDIQNEVSRALQANGWQPSLDNIFFVFTENNTTICAGSECSNNAFCAYHNFFGSDTIYAAMPYTGANPQGCIAQQGPNGDSTADAEINVTSHEQMEAATDPLLNAWLDNSGQEIGDKCAWMFGTVNPDGSNVTWSGDKYIVQEEWDNHSSSCRLTPSTNPPPPTPTPSPTRTPTMTPTPTPSGTPSPVAPWDPNSHPYKVGDKVSFQAHIYSCLQAHTSHPGWDPVDAPALWQLVS